MRRPGPLSVVVLLALAIRLLRALLRWDEIALAYVAYQQPWLDAAARGDLRGMLGTFVGLHPPLYSLLLGGVQGIWNSPAAWLLLSVLLSTGAVWILGRTCGWRPALILAADPLQWAYAAELNNYPLLVLMTTALLCQRQRVRDGAGSLALLCLLGVAAGWTHLLGGALAGLVALSLGRRSGGVMLSALALGCAPVVARSLSLAGSEGTYGQLGLDLTLLFEGLWAKSGPWLLGLPLVLRGAWRAPAWALLGGGMLTVILLFMGIGVAAAHQQPYWLMLSPCWALLLARGWPRLGPSLAAVQILSALPLEAQRLGEIWEDQQRPRALDQVLERAAPGDAIWLLAPALRPDDDKRDDSPVLWRMRPWWEAPPWREGGFEFADYRYGQPRLIQGHPVHSSTDLWLRPLDAVLRAHLEAGRRVWFVLYDHAPARDYDGKLRRALKPYEHHCVELGEDRGLGRDWLCQIDSLKRSSLEPRRSETLPPLSPPGAP